MRLSHLRDFQFNRYLESFDSVRHRPELPAGAQNGASIHGEVEATLSLLNGERLVVPGPYSFDSRFFVNFASDLLIAADAHHPKLRPRQLPFFRVALQRPEDGFRGYLANCLEKTGGAAGSFLLSSCPELDQDARLRIAVAASVRSGDFSSFLKDLSVMEREHFERVARIDQFLVSAETRVAARVPRVPLAQYGSTLLSLGAAPENPFSALAPDWDEVLRISEAARTLADAGILLADRSSVRRHARNILGEDHVADAIIEFVDSAYNEVLQDSTRSSHSSMSTPLRSRDNSLRVAQALAMYARDAADWSGAARVPSRERYALVINAERMETVVRHIIGKDELWRLLTDDDWKRSVVQLQHALTRSENNEDLDFAIASHSELVARAVAGWTLHRWENKLAWKIPVKGMETGEVGVFLSGLETVSSQIEPLMDMIPLSVQLVFHGLTGVVAIGALLKVFGVEMPVEALNRRLLHRFAHSQIANGVASTLNATLDFEQIG